MTKRDFEMKSDGVGIALFAFGVFCAVLVVQALFQGVDAGATGTVELLAALWVSSIGAFPSLVFNGALAVLGARMFLTGALPGLVRHVLGAAFLAASLSVLLGAFGGDGGGAFGARTGGALSGATHVVLGAVLGALAAIATVWFVWLRRDDLPEEEPTLVRDPDRELEAQAEQDEGVSTEEAEALLPVRIIPAPSVARAAPPPSPYPEDVRKKGEIPPGTRPLVTRESSAPAAAQAFAPSVYRWTAPGARRDGDTAVEARPAAAPVEREVEETLDVDRYTLADEETETPQARGEDKADVAAKLGALPRPAWEEGDEDGPVDAYGTPLELVKKLREQETFEEEVSEARPLVVAKTEPAPAREAEPAGVVLERRAEARIVEATESMQARAEVEPVLEAELVQEQVDGALARAELAHDRPFAETDLETEVDPVEAQRTALREELRSLTFVTETEVSADELELAEDVPAALDDELSLAVRELEAPLAEVEAAAAPIAAEEAPEAETAELVPEAVADAPAVETTLFQAAPAETAVETLPVAEAPAEAPAQPARKPEPRVLIQTLFDAPPEPASSVFTTEPEPAPKRRSKARPVEEPELVAAAVAEASAEREVVLTPPAVPAELTRRTPNGTLSSERTALLAEIGCLFIDRGRVAVSMLQRQYSMEFDDACKVLDDLQNMGLIGPYLGGQRRDILLTREAWLEKVGAS